jgi:hypothetical protein
MKIEWTIPADNGGCPITSYAVFRDDGNDSEAIYEVNQTNDSNIRDRPELFEMTVTDYPATPTGKIFKYRVQVFNEEGNSHSETMSYLLAGKPSKPPTTPTLDTTNSNFGSLMFDCAPLQTDAQTGGAQILTYNI